MKCIALICVFVGTLCSQLIAQTIVRQFPWEISNQGKEEYKSLTAASKAFYEAIAKRDWKTVTEYIPHSSDAVNKVYYDPLLAARYFGDGVKISPYNAITVDVNGNKGFLLEIVYEESNTPKDVKKSVQTWNDVWFVQEGKWFVLAGSALNQTKNQTIKVQTDFCSIDGWMISENDAVKEEEKRISRLNELKKENDIFLKKEIDKLSIPSKSEESKP